MTPAEREIAKQRRALMRIESNGMSEIARSYQVVLMDLQGNLKGLTERIEQARAAGIEVRPGWLAAEDRYRSLISQHEQHTLRYLQDCISTIRNGKGAAIVQAEGDAPRLTTTAMGQAPASAEAAVANSFSQLPTDQMARLVANAADGRPLGELLYEVAPKATQKVKDALNAGVARGASVRVIAADAVKASGIAQNRAMLISRTECLTADAVIESDGIQAVYRRWYEGTVIRVRMSSGHEFTATPNHPVLTSEGWIGAGSLVPGDDLVRHAGGQKLRTSGNQHVGDVPTRIGEVFDSLAAVGVTVRAATGEPDFHGDGRNGYVDVATTDGELVDRLKAQDAQHADHLALEATGAATPRLHGSRGLHGAVPTGPGAAHYPHRLQVAADGVFVEAMAKGQIAEAGSGLIFPRQFLGVEAESLRLGDRANRYPSVGEYGASLCSVDAEVLRDSPEAVARQVGRDHVVSVDRLEFRGHVYNLSTDRGWFAVGPYFSGNTIRAYRETSLAAYRSSPAVAGWIWIAQATACPVCQAEHGSEHTLDETLDSHPACRCTAMPKTLSWAELGYPGIADGRPSIQPGPERFAALPEADKLAVLGRARLDAYNAGEITLHDMVRETHSERWGAGKRTATLAELGVG